MNTWVSQMSIKVEVCTEYVDASKTEEILKEIKKLLENCTDGNK